MKSTVTSEIDERYLKSPEAPQDFLPHSLTFGEDTVPRLVSRVQGPTLQKALGTRATETKTRGSRPQTIHVRKRNWELSDHDT